MTSATAHTITFYTNFLTFHPAKVAVLLKEKNLPHKKVEMDVLGGGSLQPWFMKLNPKSYVPVVELDGNVIYESKKVCETIDNLDGNPLGGSQVDRALVQQLVDQIDMFDGNLWAFAHTPAGLKKTMEGLDDYKKKVSLAQAKRHPELREAYEEKAQTSGKLLAASNDKAKVDECEKILSDLFDVAEQRLSSTKVPEGSDGPFLAGTAYSLADAMFATILFRVWNLGSYKQLIEPRPALAAYNKRVRQRPSWDVAFGRAASPFGKASVLPILIKTKVSSLLGWY